MKLEETPAFKQEAAYAHAQASGKRADEDPVEQARQSGKGRVREIFARHWEAVLICMGLVLLYNVTKYMVTSYLPTYMTVTLGESDTTAAGPRHDAPGRPADHDRRQNVRPVGTQTHVHGREYRTHRAVLSRVPADQGGRHPASGVRVRDPRHVVRHVRGNRNRHTAGPLSTRIRYGALSIAYNLSVSLFGGTTPLFASGLVEATGNNMVPAYYLMAAGVIGLISTFFLHETAGRPLGGSGPMVETPEQARRLVARSRTAAGRQARDIWVRLRHPHARHSSDDE